MQPTVQNPNNPDHCMWIQPIERRVVVRHAQTEALIAETAAALRVVEMGKSLYPPMVYVPKADIKAQLSDLPNVHTTCPIKGTASYFDILLPDGAALPKTAWTYEAPVAGAEALQDHLAFYLDHVVVSEGPL